MSGRRPIVTALVTGLLCHVAGAGVARAQGWAEIQADQARPFRLGYFNLNEQYNEEKPLALLDGAGFVINSGLFIGAWDNRWVGGMSLATRKVEWWFDGVVTMTAPPGSFGSSVVLGFRDGRVVKVDALTGKAQWTVTLDSFSERSFLLNGTVLYAVTAAQVLYALDFQTGKTLWLHDAGFPEGLTIRGGARPIFHDGKVILGVASGEVLAVSADSGKLLWRYNPAYNDARFHDVVGELVVRNNRLIMTRYDGLVAAIDLAGAARSVVWQERLTGGLTTSAFRNSRYYVGALNGDVYAIDPDNNGRRVWRAVNGPAVTNIAVAESVLQVSGQDGRISAFDNATGNLIWHDQLGSAIGSPPTLSEDAIYYATAHKAVYSYRLR